MGERVERVARLGKIDCIYAHGLCAWGVRHAAEWGVPLIANPHGLEEFKVRDPLKRLAYAPFRAWVREGCRAANRVIATDEAMRAEVASLLKIPEKKVAVVPNGVDISLIATLVSDETKEKLIERWPTLAGEPAALHGTSVGRLEENKGFEVLLRALASVRDELGENWSWVLVGEGTLRSHLESIVACLGLGKHVLFAGALSDPELHTLYSMSNLFAHPALYEGSSLVTLEAMAHALPVVASAVGGIPDKVVDGETGFLVSPGEHGELGARIAWLAVRLDTLRRMGERGAKLAAERFSMESVAAKLEGLFMQVISEKSPCRDEESVPSPC
jgi:glycosyltransferase involved in cell wall biosynthesis